MRVFLSFCFVILLKVNSAWICLLESNIIGAVIVHYASVRPQPGTFCWGSESPSWHPWNTATDVFTHRASRHFRSVLIMEPDETVLSDIHIDLSQTRPFDHTEDLDSVRYAG